MGEAMARLESSDAAAAERLHAARQVLTQACLVGQREAALAVVREAIRGGCAVVDAYVDLLQESQIEVGRRWQANEISVAQEHMATAVTQYVMARLYPELEPPRQPRGRAVITGVEGEHHQLGANMVADLLETEGWDVRFLGSDVPTPSVVQAVREHGATLVGISAATLPNLSRVRDLVARLRGAHRRAATDPPLRILVGGCLFRGQPELWRTTGADGFGADLRALRAHVQAADASPPGLL